MFCLNILFLILYTIFYLTNQVVTNQNSRLNSSSENKKEWHEIDSLENKGLTRSALNIVDQIYNKSLIENNSPQLIKSLIFKLKYTNYTEENSTKKIIYQIQNTIDSSSFPAKPILQSILADAFWQYYQQNRYKFINRTEAINFNNNDFETWDLFRLLKEIINLYQASLSNSDSLKNTSVSDFKDILVLYKDRSYLRPTLYDFLANRALDFYTNQEASVTEPVFKFELKDPHAFLPVDQFININFHTKDSLSLKFYAVQILQNLISFHLNDPVKDPLIDIDLKRLNFVRANSVIEYKDSLYLNALNGMENKYAGVPFSSLILYNKAIYYYEKGNQFEPETAIQYKWDKKKAYDICDNAIEKYPASAGAEACASLKSQISNKNLSFRVEYANIIDQPFRVLVQYTNVSKIYFRVIPWNESKEKEADKLKGKSLIDYFRSQTGIKEWSTNLPDEKDFQPHSVEAAVPALEPGQYLILIGTGKEFSYQENAVAYNYAWVTNLSYIYKSDGSKIQLFVLDRKSGHPVKEAKISLFRQSYDGRSSNYKQELIESGATDRTGSFIFKYSPGKFYNFQVLLEKGKDKFLSKNIYSNYQNHNSRIVTKTFFFLDRAIYRPGQTVFFKGLMMETDGKKVNNLKTNTSTTVEFYDVNNQKISELKLKTNDYGTFNGKFIAPSGVLTGVMSIRNETGAESFRVEEYKRPQFEVKLNKIEGDYSLNDTVNISGYAKTYSGVNLDNATVKYRVVRRAIIPFWWYWRPNKPDMEIINGEAKTDSEGKFNFDFRLIPDLSYSRKENTIFNYTVYVDVVDITGETHSSEISVSAGYISLLADIQIPETINKLDTNKYKVTSTNLSGQFQPAKFNVKVYRLIEPERVFRKRLWEKPDQFILSKQEYYKLFPHDVYNDEDKIYNWEKGKQVFETSFTTSDSSYLNINKEIKKWKIGSYLLAAETKDKNGTPIELKKYFTIYDPSTDEVPINSANWLAEIKTSGEPGETAELLIGSALNDVKILYELEYDGKIIHSEWLTIADEQQKIEIPIKEEYRGNLIANFISTVNNENIYKKVIINIPWTNKHLNISLETFRNKITPGGKEEWKVRITGSKGEKETAEMLASMYDASLDAFAVNNWNFDVYPEYSYGRTDWNTDNSFTSNFSMLFESGWNQLINFPPMHYNQLNYFGFSLFNFGYAKRNPIYFKSDFKAAPVSPTSEAMSITALQDVTNITATGINETKKEEKKTEVNFEDISARKNLNETAFFYPDLQTDENGDIIISFTAPEALTRWKFMAFAHTKDLKYGLITKETVTQKELMIQPNPPRFFREGDTVYFTAKVSNLSENDLSGSAALNAL